MSNHPRKVLKEITALLLGHQIKVLSVETLSRHRRIWITNGVKTAPMIIPVSPSDRRYQMNVLRDARRSLREAP